MQSETLHPRDRFITVYGRKPVLEALQDRSLDCNKLLLARNASGDTLNEILAAAKARGLKVQRVEPKAVTRLSRNGRQDQGVVLDIEAPRMQALDAWLDDLPSKARVFCLDGLTNPANVGMILRAATGAGLEGVVLPRQGCPEISPLVIKASAGIAFRAPILRAPTMVEAAKALSHAGFTIYGLRATQAVNLYEAEFPAKCAFVLGGETLGLSAELDPYLGGFISIPLYNGVESLNVATAGAVVAFELARRQRS